MCQERGDRTFVLDQMLQANIEMNKEFVSKFFPSFEKVLTLRCKNMLIKATETSLIFNKN